MKFLGRLHAREGGLLHLAWASASAVRLIFARGMRGWRCFLALAATEFSGMRDLFRKIKVQA